MKVLSSFIHPQVIDFLPWSTKGVFKKRCKKYHKGLIKIVQYILLKQYNDSIGLLS